MGTMHVIFDWGFSFRTFKYYHLEFRKSAIALVHAELQIENNKLGVKGPLLSCLILLSPDYFTTFQ